jgi:hypothetical protein
MMAADEDDCVSYACECVRLAGLTTTLFAKSFLNSPATGSLRGRLIIATRGWARSLHPPTQTSCKSSWTPPGL